MTTSQRFLIIGLDPEKLEMNAPGLPPGVSAEALKAGSPESKLPSRPKAIVWSLAA